MPVGWIPEKIIWGGCCCGGWELERSEDDGGGLEEDEMGRVVCGWRGLWTGFGKEDEVLWKSFRRKGGRRDVMLCVVCKERRGAWFSRLQREDT